MTKIGAERPRAVADVQSHGLRLVAKALQLHVGLLLPARDDRPRHGDGDDQRLGDAQREILQDHGAGLLLKLAGPDDSDGELALRQIDRAFERHANRFQAVLNRRNFRRDAGRQPFDDNGHRIFERFVRPGDVDVEGRRADELREIKLRACQR